MADEEALRINAIQLSDDYDYLLADGLWVTAKGYGLEEDKAVILCVLGVKPDGTRTIIGFSVARDESYAAWHELLVSIKQRGMVGRNLKLIISDDGQGFDGAIAQLFPSIEHQICLVHKMRHVLTKTSFKHKKEMGTDLSIAFNQESKEAALLVIKALCKKWYVLEPKAIDSLKYHLLDTLTYFDFDKSLWEKIRTNNILEREFREVRRRIRVMDSSFNDKDSTTRYAGSIINYLNQHYPAEMKPKLHTNP